MWYFRSLQQWIRPRRPLLDVQIKIGMHGLILLRNSRWLGFRYLIGIPACKHISIEWYPSERHDLLGHLAVLNDQGSGAISLDRLLLLNKECPGCPLSHAVRKISRLIDFRPLSLVAWTCRILIVGYVCVVWERLKLLVLCWINYELIVIPFAVTWSAGWLS